MPEAMGEEAARQAAGEHWDQGEFEQRAAENFITGEVTISRFDLLAFARSKGIGAAPHPLLDQITAMSSEDLAAESERVLAAAVEREKLRKKKMPAAASAAATDYSKSLSGTAADTKAEKDFEKMMREGAGDAAAAAPDEDCDPLLVPVTGLPADVYEAVRAAGEWRKFLGAAGCYLYVHSLLREVETTAPRDYVERAEAAVVDTFGGLPQIQLAEVSAEIERICTDLKLTPLLLDASEDRKVATFYKYKGVCIDLASLALPQRDKRRPKPKEVAEICRKSAVSAMKRGSVCVLDIGESDGDKAPFFSKFCKHDSFRKETFFEGGAAIARNKMALRKMFRQDEQEHGECIVRDGFRFALISSLPPKTYAKELGTEAFELEKFYPLVVVSD